MSYDYIRRAYGVTPEPGSRVRHTVTGQEGVITRAVGDPQYVRVRFDGRSFAVPCHPEELDYRP